MLKYASTEILSAEMGLQSHTYRTAHRHNFVYEKKPGYLYVRSRAISSRCNDNYDEFPAPEIKQAYLSFIGKPVFVNHHNDNHRRARGVIIDAALHEDLNPDGSPDTWVEVLMMVDAVRFPKLATAILAGHIDRTSMGTDVAYSVCSFCGNKAASPVEYCAHIPKLKGQRIYRRNASTGEQEGVLVREVCYGLSFFENSLLVEEPADPTAFFLGVDGIGVTASKTAADDWVSKLKVIQQKGATGSAWLTPDGEIINVSDHDKSADALGFSSGGELSRQTGAVRLNISTQRDPRWPGEVSAAIYLGNPSLTRAQREAIDIAAWGKRFVVVGPGASLPGIIVEPDHDSDDINRAINQAVNARAMASRKTAAYGPPNNSVKIDPPIRVKTNRAYTIQSGWGTQMHNEMGNVFTVPAGTEGEAVYWWPESGRIKYGVTFEEGSISRTTDPGDLYRSNFVAISEDSLTFIDPKPTTSTERVPAAKCPASGLRVIEMVNRWGDGGQSNLYNQFNFTCTACGAYVKQTRQGAVSSHKSANPVEARLAASSGGVHFHVLPNNAEEAHKALREHYKRKTSALAAWDSAWNKEALHALASTGGFSIHDHFGDAPKTGFMVSDEGAEDSAHSVEDVRSDPSIIAAYYDAHEDAVLDPDAYIGAWEYDGKMFFDVSRHYPNEDDAIEAAIKNHQLAYYDLSNGKSIDTPKRTTSMRRVAALSRDEINRMENIVTKYIGHYNSNITWLLQHVPDASAERVMNTILDRDAVAARNLLGDGTEVWVKDQAEWEPRLLAAVQTMLDEINSGSTTASKLGYGEILAPKDVDTLRDEACPVCGEQDSFDGEKCQVCQFVKPPDDFMDPDLEKAKNTDLRQNMDDAHSGEGDLKCNNCGATFHSEENSVPDTSGQGGEAPAFIPPKQGVLEDLTDEQYDLADRIQVALEASPNEWMTPSTIARKIKASTNGLISVLSWMVKNDYIYADQRGAWTKYRARRMGEYNAVLDAGSGDHQFSLTKPKEDDGNVGNEEQADTAPKAGDICPDCGVGTLQAIAGPSDQDAQQPPPADPNATPPADAKDGADDQNAPSDDDDKDGEDDADDDKKPDFLKKKKKPDEAKKASTLSNPANLLTQGVNDSTEKPEGVISMARPALQALAAQQRMIQHQAKQIEALKGVVNIVCEAAGISTHPRVASLLKQADENNPAQPIPDPPSEAPAATTAETLGDLNDDDPTAIGASPLTDVSPGATTSVDSTDTVLNEPLDLNEQDPTRPVSGTEGPLPLNDVKIETDVRVGDPNDPTPGFPLEPAFSDQPKTTGSRGEARTIASLRLARLRIQAGIAQTNDDLSLATMISADASVKDSDIQAEIATLAKVVQVSGQNRQPVSRSLVPRAASAAQRTMPSVAQTPIEENTLHVGALTPTSDEMIFE